MYGGPWTAMSPESAERMAETERISKACKRTLADLASMKLDEAMRMTDHSMIARGVRHYLDLLKEEADAEGV